MLRGYARRNILRTLFADSLCLGSCFSIFFTRSLAALEMWGQGALSKSTCPRRTASKMPCSFSAQKGGTPAGVEGKDLEQVSPLRDSIALNYFDSLNSLNSLYFCSPEIGMKLDWNGGMEGRRNGDNSFLCIIRTYVQHCVHFWIQNMPKKMTPGLQTLVPEALTREENVEDDPTTPHIRLRPVFAAQYLRRHVIRTANNVGKRLPCN